MAFRYMSESFMCKCKRSTKLYAEATDISPTISEILVSGQCFISTRQATSNGSFMYQISSPFSKNDELPIGYWCPGNCLEVAPVMYEEAELETKTETYVTSESGVIIYTTKDGDRQFQHTLSAGVEIEVDDSYEVMKNGIIQTRRHIVKSDDESLIDNWLLVNKAVDLKNDTEEVLVAPAARRMYRAKAKAVNAPAPQDEDPPAEDPPAENPDDPGTGEGTGDSATITIDASAESESKIKGSDDYKPITEEDIDQAMSSEGKTLTITGNASATQIASLYAMYEMNYNESAVEGQMSLMSIPIGRMTFVHGMPFQYNYITDRRRGASGRYGSLLETDTGVKNTSTPGRDGEDTTVDMYGHTFAKEIAGNMPIAVIVPGVPVYLTKAKTGLFGYRGTSHKAVRLWQPLWQAADTLTPDEYQSALNNLISGLDETGDTFDYFTLQVDTEMYFKYVNSLCRNSARLMGIGDREIRGTAAKNFDWGTYDKAVDQDYNAFENVVGLSGGVSFAYDPLSAVSDTIGNTTAESSLVGQFNNIGSMAKELQFITGQSGTAAGTIDFTEYEASLGSTGGNNGGILGSVGGLIGRVKDLGVNAAKGFNIRFPEIWQDSSHTRSYSIDIHFISPYATAFCKWRYVLVPFFHVFALAAPQAPDNMSVYGRPFLIKAFSKGYFNVECGIIESLNWKRFGDGDMISSDGVPMQIDVTIDFKDLYHVLTMGNAEMGHIGAFFNNTGLMDLLGTLSGVNMNRISLSERVALFSGSFGNSVFGIGGNFMRHISDRTRSFAERYLYGT